MSDIIRDQSTRIDEGLKKMLNEIDRDYFRKMQGVMHRCAARCCDSTTGSMEQVQNCVQNCSQGLIEAQEYVRQEVGTTQNRLQRCILECNDDIKDKMGVSPTDLEQAKYSKEFEGCAIRCVDKHVDSLPNMFKRMKQVLEQKQQNSALYYPNL